MSVRLLEGFELGALPVNTGITLEEASASVVATSPATGGYCLSCTTDTTGAGIICALGTLSAASGWCWVGFAFKTTAMNSCTNGSSYFPFATVKDGGSNRVHIGHTEGGVLRIGAGTGEYTSMPGTAADVSDPVLAPNVWNYVEVGFTLQDAGQVIVRLNGVEVINYSGDTRPHATAADTTRQLILYGPYATGTTHYFDDVYGVLEDGSGVEDFLGPCSVVHLLPTSDSAVGFSRSAGSDNYALVDDRPVSTADYNQATGVASDLFGLTDLGVAGTIHAVAARAVAYNPDAGAASFRVQVSSNATASETGDLTLPSTTTNVEELILELDPDGSVAWTDSAVDALLAGYRVAA